MQFIRFAIIGGCNTGLSLACICSLIWIFDMDYRLANVVGYLIGCVSSFFANRSWTFHDAGSVWPSMMRWFAVVAVAYLFNLTTMQSLHDLFHVDKYAVQFVGNVVYTATSFVLVRAFVFASSQR